MATDGTLTTKLRKLTLTVIIGLGSIGAWTGWSKISKWIDSSREGEKAQLSVAQDFLLKDSTGKSRKLSDFKGQPVILHFWASWCPPCLDEIDHLVEFSKQLESSGKSNWVVIAVSLDQSWEDVKKLIRLDQLPKSLVVLIDPEMKSSEMYGSFQYPETYLINSDHEVVTKWVGPQPWSQSGVVDKLNKILNLKR